eukprot:CAMPEP_0117654864 /NCGR_PEP_ID=MMETSP0804-20121206/3974_1 /TAXON_ID=1074897 /ORGANISM="Tetraselmis astigmatica, Strain CCMP880" /LENGTH=398 /DNA_ID=CAMNT_0005461179 /DNA_START=185 /DNA_END=1380 /DNA_ORIENTATION=-
MTAVAPWQERNTFAWNLYMVVYPRAQRRCHDAGVMDSDALRLACDEEGLSSSQLSPRRPSTSSTRKYARQLARVPLGCPPSSSSSCCCSHSSTPERPISSSPCWLYRAKSTMASLWHSSSSVSNAEAVVPPPEQISPFNSPRLCSTLCRKWFRKWASGGLEHLEPLGAARRQLPDEVASTLLKPVARVQPGPGAAQPPLCQCAEVNHHLEVRLDVIAARLGSQHRPCRGDFLRQRPELAPTQPVAEELLKMDVHCHVEDLRVAAALLGEGGGALIAPCLPCIHPCPVGIQEPLDVVQWHLPLVELKQKPLPRAAHRPEREVQRRSQQGLPSIGRNKVDGEAESQPHALGEREVQHGQQLQSLGLVPNSPTNWLDLKPPLVHNAVKDVITPGAVLLMRH